MKILICGDDYAYEKDNRYLGWSLHLKKMMPDAFIKNISQKGLGVYNLQMLFKEKLNDFDVLIYVSMDTAKPIGILETNDNKHLVKAVNLYHKHLYDEELHRLTYNKILDKLIDTFKKKIILVDGEIELSKISKYSDFTFPLSMKAISQAELAQHNYVINCDFWDNYEETSNHLNHMSEENRMVFANHIKQRITTGSSSMSIKSFLPIDTFDKYYKRKNT